MTQLEMTTQSAKWNII